MDQSSASSRIAGAVRDLASEVVFALQSEDHLSTVCGAAGIGEDDSTGIAAVRVIGADLLLPSLLYGRDPHPGDVAALQRAVIDFPPRAGAPASTAWSHWAMELALGAPATGEAPVEPAAAWLEQAPWQAFTHQLSVLAPLARPSSASAVNRVAARRPVDVARGFVRAVRRRDWLQAAGAGRWLATLDGVPDTLGLAAGLDFVQLMGGQDPRVALHLRAAGLIRAGQAR
ncbi:hypothetical protein G3I19_28630 [Streptomyces sp. SID10853]|uniref:hypothetical protein n=1 Tax=Streptomyces sp. SID10853 TaxID=2706028 RepID=UPI0013BF6970|nr:hypothetical protein [Streptomyces sp. SID10853]NDZ82431.1 hypothetical protein [Streptomyces sp. SID10853]